MDRNSQQFYAPNAQLNEPRQEHGPDQQIDTPSQSPDEVEGGQTFFLGCLRSKAGNVHALEERN